MRRLRLDLEYDGTAFHGWAAQPGLRTVEGVLSGALAVASRQPAEAVALVVAGRTDAGVHATGQVCHTDLALDLAFHAREGAGAGAARGAPAGARPAPLDARVDAGAPPVGPEVLLRRLRGLLPPDVRVTALAPAPAGFDARFSALRRHYRYAVADGPAGVPPLRRHDVVAHPRPLDTAAMTRAGEALLGLHDFAAFCRRRVGPDGAASTVRTLERLTWERDADGLAVMRVSADAFCHSMVRALVGVLLPVGDGRRDAGWPVRVLAARVRDPAVVVAPARGLALVGVDYPDEASLASRAAESRAVRTLPTP